MKNYEVVIIGGSIAGSVAGRYLADAGISTLIVEAAKTPREKPCSGIQFKYFEKLLGLKIPKERLCQNEIRRLYMELPNGKSYNLPFKMLNFTRDVFDNWLNELAIESGAEFRDGVRCTDIKKIDEGYIITLRPKHQDVEQVSTKYLIVADGLSSSIRRKIRPEDFSRKPLAPAMNYYLKTEGDGDLNPHALYQFWNLDFNNLMFAWTYKKNDLWVVGTGHTDNLIDRCDNLLNYVKDKFKLKGEIVKREGYASTFKLDAPNHVFLGFDNMMFVGDAAGLIDMYRGLGMDAAALSGRLVANAIIKGDGSATPPLKLYEKMMQKIIKKININSEKQLLTYNTNDELLHALKKSFIKMGLGTFFGTLLNKFRKPTKIKLLPA
ncbi:MAG: NAD(P)/FAD-dependent oxidoreductase [Promethearchaeota archaeon]